MGKHNGLAFWYVFKHVAFKWSTYLFVSPPQLKKKTCQWHQQFFLARQPSPKKIYAINTMCSALTTCVHQYTRRNKEVFYAHTCFLHRAYLWSSEWQEKGYEIFFASLQHTQRHSWWGCFVVIYGSTRMLALRCAHMRIRCVFYFGNHLEKKQPWPLKRFSLIFFEWTCFLVFINKYAHKQLHVYYFFYSSIHYSV